METGEAYSPPSYQPPKGESRALIKLWEAIAPGESVPAAVAALQDRLDHRSGSPDSPSVLPAVPDSSGGDRSSPQVAKEEVPQAQGPAFNAPDGCNNGCCDYNWLYTTFGECSDDYDFDWMLFNYNDALANVNDVWWFDGFVCSAIGTSRWRFTLGSAKSVDVNVAQQHWLTDYWIAPVNPWPWGGWYYDEDLRSTVTGSLFTYCGGAFKD